MTDDDEVDPAGAPVAEALRASSAGAARLVDDHVEHNEGEVLSTILLADVARWFVSAISEETAEADDARASVGALDVLFEQGDDEVQTVVVTGFVEALPFAHEEGRQVVEELPPALREQLRRWDSWNSAGA